MSDDDHCVLLTVLQQLDGFIVLSGYDYNLYNVTLYDWVKHTTKAWISVGRATGTRTDCVWSNSSCADLQVHVKLFSECAIVGRKHLCA